MPIYIVTYIFILILSFFEFYTEKINNKYLKGGIYALIIFYLIILTGFRYNVGTDFSTYLSIFNLVDSLADTAAYSYLEPGFRAIIIFFKALNFQPYSLFLIFSTILFSFLGIGIYRTSKRPFLSLFTFVLIFWIGYVMNVLRQGIAMSILIYAIPYIEEKKITPVMLLTFLASSIHFTGIFIIVSYFGYHFSVNKYTYINLTILSVVFYLNSTAFFELVAAVLPSRFQDLLISYMERFPGGVDLTSYLLRLTILMLFLFFYDLLKQHQGFKGIFNIYFFGFLLYTILSFQGQAATRINMFFRILEILLFPYLLLITNKKIYQIILYSLVVAIGTVILLSDLSNPVNFPFNFYWEYG